MDPFVTLTMAAAVTKTLKIGTGVCLVNQRDTDPDGEAGCHDRPGFRRPFPVRHRHRLEPDEMEDHGTVSPPAHKLVRERVEAMKPIWTKAKPEYHGELVNFDPMMAWPKPVQKPHPPVIVGGAFP